MHSVGSWISGWPELAFWGYGGYLITESHRRWRRWELSNLEREGGNVWVRTKGQKIGKVLVSPLNDEPFIYWSDKGGSQLAWDVWRPSLGSTLPRMPTIPCFRPLRSYHGMAGGGCEGSCSTQVSDLGDRIKGRHMVVVKELLLWYGF